jgi:hypothetical protein
VNLDYLTALRVVEIKALVGKGAIQRCLVAQHPNDIEVVEPRWLLEESPQALVRLLHRLVVRVELEDGEVVPGTIPVGDNETAPRRATGRSRRPVATAWTRRTWRYFSGLVANVPVSVSVCIGRMGERALTL